MFRRCVVSLLLNDEEQHLPSVLLGHGLRNTWRIRKDLRTNTPRVTYFSESQGYPRSNVHERVTTLTRFRSDLTVLAHPSIDAQGIMC